MENQHYIRYLKGSLVLYRLREEMGEAALNRALKKFLQNKGYQQRRRQPRRSCWTISAPKPTEAAGTDLGSVRDNQLLRQPGPGSDGASVRTASTKSPSTLFAAKRHADGKGKETAGKLDDWIEVGVFARGPRARKPTRRCCTCSVTASPEHPEFTVVVDTLPYEAGFDPYNKLIDRVSMGNRKRVAL